MASWPCSNPNCNSCGTPHENCKCAPPVAMAEGGEVPHFCASEMPHDPSCDYHSNPQAEVAAVHTAGAHALFAGNPKYQRDVKKGKKDIQAHVDDLFSPSTTKTIKPDVDKRDKLNKFISTGGMTNEIKSQDVPDNTTIPPGQSLMLNASKGKVYSYLNNLRPVPDSFQSKLPFDTATPNKDAERTYHRALDVANNPLSVLHHMKTGTMLPEHVSHINGMYPELTDHLQKKLTEKITEAQMKGEKPAYKTRMGMSIFMGTNLDSTLTPQNMQAAQATFAPMQAAAQPQSGTKEKGSKKALGKVADEYKTQTDAAASRAQQ